MRCLAVGLLAFLLVLSGCSPDDTATPAEGESEDREPSEALAFAGALGGAPLRMAMVRPESLRPDEVVLSDQPAVVLSDLLYDGLTEIGGDGATLQPGLASSWEASDDFRRWTFRLDPAHGVTADAVVRTLTPLLTSTDQGLPAVRPGAALAAGMTAVRQLDDHTVEIEVDDPNAGLPWVVSGVAFSVVGIDGAPTGDYEVVRDDADRLELIRRDGRGGVLGPYPEIEMVWTDAPGSAYRLLADGAVDAAIVGPESLVHAERRFDVMGAATATVRFYVLNPGSADLADRERRAALLELVDTRSALAAAGRADLVEADGLVSPSLAGYGPDSCGAACGELDDGAGGLDTTAAPWPSDVPLGVTYAGDGQSGTAESLAEQLRAAGVPALAREATARDLARSIVDGSPDMFAFGWVAPAGSVDAVLPALLRADSPANVARFSSPGIEELLDTAAQTGDDAARWTLLERAHRLALSEAKVLPVAASTGTLVVSSDSSGFAMRADGSIDLETSR